jgi:hypothetical protein
MPRQPVAFEKWSKSAYEGSNSHHYDYAAAERKREEAKKKQKEEQEAQVAAEKAAHQVRLNVCDMIE